MIKLLQSEIDFGDHIVVKRTSRARRMSLRLDAQARVFHLIMPPRMSLRRAQRFAEEHESWMQKRLAELAPPICIENGAIIPLFGQKTKIEIDYDDGLRATRITLENNKLIVQTNLDDPGPRIKRYLKKLAKERISALAHKKAATLGKKINKIYIRDTKTRWGSCSAENNLNFSWRLIFAPYESFDYVIAHEVAHLKHLDHSKKFWAVCEKLSENYKVGKKWMRTNSQELMLYS